MNISRNDLRKAAAGSGLAPDQADQLWQNLESAGADRGTPRFNGANVTYYLGALIVIGAMGWFMTRAWEHLGGLGLFGVAIGYAVCFLIVGSKFWKKPELRIPGGLLVTMAVCMAPLATYGLERWTGFWPANDPGAYARFHPYINGSWLIMEVGTVLAGLLALRYFRFPFITAPIAFALWYMSMDLIHLISGSGYLGWQEKANISAVFGALMLIAAYAVDLRTNASDFAFWSYLFGLMIFWGGLTSMESHSEVGRFVYCVINLFLIVCSVALRRRAFIVFGGLGVMSYVGHLAYSVFQDSMLFPLVLTLIGLAIIALGVLYQRHRAQIERRFQAAIGLHLQGFIPERALAD
jgi:hypothetical protein